MISASVVIAAVVQRWRLTIKRPIARGGRSVQSNLQTLCRVCNSKKSTFTDPEYRLIRQFLADNPGRGYSKYDAVKWLKKWGHWPD